MKAPTHASIEAWALAYIRSTEVAAKCADPGPLLELEPCADLDKSARRELRPGRPPQLEVLARSRRSIHPRGLDDPRLRAEVLHAFWHHELQAAELMAWALLVFADAPRAFRLGLFRIARDEIRHMGLYQREVERLGYDIGDFPVRDWFWQRVPQCESPLDFVAIMGLGLEAANLDHSQRFARAFAEAGDDAAAEVQRLVAREEIGHVRFGVTWFRALHGAFDFEAWRAQLVAPLSPMLFRGAEVDRVARSDAGMDDAFLDALEGFSPSPSGGAGQPR